MRHAHIAAVLDDVGLDGGAGGAGARGEHFACRMHALSAAERARQHALSSELLGSVAERTELADGYGFRFAPR